MSDEITFDLSSLKSIKIVPFFKKYGVIFLLIIPVLLSAQIRLIPSTLPITDDWAKSTVENYYKSNIQTQIRQQYPNLPDQNVNTLVDQQWQAAYKQNKAQILAQIEQTSQQFKDQFRDENGYTYMPDIDPYAFLRHARNYLDHGYVGDIKKNGEDWDTHMIAPKGTTVGVKSHPIVLAYLYKIMHFFNSKITLMQSATYHPIIFVALSIIPIFFIARMFSGNTGAFFAGIIMAINGAYLGRTTWGHADTDSYNILFAVLFVWFFFLSMRQHNFKKSAIYAALAGFTIGVFSIFWSGWWYVFDFVLGTIGLYLLYVFIFEDKFSMKRVIENAQSKRIILASVVLILVSGVFVSLFTTPGAFIRSPLEPLGFANIKEASLADLWPNVYTTVAELNSASFDDIVGSLGGKVFYYTAIFGMLLLFLVRKGESTERTNYVLLLALAVFIMYLGSAKNINLFFYVGLLATAFIFVKDFFTKTEGRKEYLAYALLILIWGAGIFYASTKGVRFTMMLVPPISLAIGAAIGITYKKLMTYLEGMGISPKITGTVFIILVLLIINPYIVGAKSAVKNEVPLVNDAWYNALTKIKVESKPDAIINSWWDFGHHFKYIADRAVTFDGASQNSPMAHWIGKVLLTDNEQQAIGILRMLDCGSNDAFEALNKIVNDTPTSVKMLYDIIAMDSTGAQSYLTSKGINKETSLEVLKFTHCNPPEDYFITSEDMIGKAGVWGHFGSWDFNKADIWSNARNLPKDEAIKRIEKRLNLNEDEAKKIYVQLKSIANEGDANQWIAPWPGYGGQQSCSKQGNSSKLICGGYLVDLDTKDVQISTSEGIKRPYSIVYVENNSFQEKKINGQIDQTIMLINKNGSYNIVQASTSTATSIFTRLFFYDGIGLEHFKKFTEEHALTGDKIVVWKVAW